jgi:CRP-like cAMP-binding protein
MPVQVDLLSGLPLFIGLSSVELEEMASLLETTESKPRDVLIREGDPPDHPIYILLKGAVEVVKHGVDNRDHIISTLGAPSVFGEIEVLARRPAIASVLTIGPVLLAKLRRELRRGVFDELCQQNRPGMLKVVRNLATTLAYRLAATDERLAAYFSTSAPDEAAALGQMRNLLYSSWQTAKD